MVAMVMVSGTDTPAVASRCWKIRSVRAGLMLVMDGLAHTLMISEGSDWLKMSMTSSADSCGKEVFFVFFVLFSCFFCFILYFYFTGVKQSKKKRIEFHNFFCI